MRDSNPRSRDQNPLPYRLANPQWFAAGALNIAAADSGVTGVIIARPGEYYQRFRRCAETYAADLSLVRKLPPVYHCQQTRARTFYVSCCSRVS